VEGGPAYTSRQAASDAGWDPDSPGEVPAYHERLRRRFKPREFSWLRPWPLLESANQAVDALLSDIVTPRRQRWMAARRAAGVKDLTFRTVDEDGRAFSFLLIGDPGEADPSQYAVVDPLLVRGDDTEFMVIVSDVIYPAGDVNDYVNAFYIPYRDYKRPIYALPGNHDWIDGLSGFMFHFCDTEALPPPGYRRAGIGLSGRLAALFWRASSRPERDMLEAYRSRPPLDPPQPGPYWAMDVGPLRLVAIDIGVDGRIEREQAEWLLEVSACDRPKLLLTGKPLYVNHKYEPGRVYAPRNPDDLGTDLMLDGALLKTVDQVVRHPGHRYIAAIGGDIHNYQRYRARMPCGDHEIQYIVSGGGGAYLSTTHTLGRAEREEWDGPDAIEEKRFRCYPLRGDSLYHFARLARRGSIRLVLGATVLMAALLAAAYVLLKATGTTWDPPVLSADTTRSFDAVELGVLIGLGSAVGLLLPLVVLSDWRRGLGNGAKLGLLAAVVLWAASLDQPTPWVVGALTLAGPAHAALFPRRRLFSALLLFFGLTSLAWILRDTWVYDHTSELLVVPLGLLAAYFMRRLWEQRHPVKPLIGVLIVALIGVPLFFFGLAKVLAGLLAFAALIILLLLLLSRLILFALLRCVRAPGRLVDAGWSRDPTPDEATKWFSENRLNGMPPTRDAARAVQVSGIPRLARLEFRWISRKTGPGRLAQSKFSEIFDTNDPPFFRHFLKVDVDPATQEVTIKCLAATGRFRHQGNPPVEDWVRVSFDGRFLAQLEDA
jgi:hypothetical protein